MALSHFARMGLIAGVSPIVGGCRIPTRPLSLLRGREALTREALTGFIGTVAGSSISETADLGSRMSPKVLYCFPIATLVRKAVEVSYLVYLRTASCRVVIPRLGSCFVVPLIRVVAHLRRIERNPPVRAPPSVLCMCFPLPHVVLVQAEFP